MSVTVITCAYGTRYGRFIPNWCETIAKLDPKPDKVIVATDEMYLCPGADIVKVSDCPWEYPQAFYLSAAVAIARTEWVWIVDIDDYAMPDALQGLEDVDADVWQMGFKRSDGETYVVPQLSNTEYLASDRNVYTAGSAFRVKAFRDCGGFPDVALQDWALWRRMAANGARIVSSGRTHYHYMRHAYTRGETELTLDHRAAHLAEMEAALAA